MASEVLLEGEGEGDGLTALFENAAASVSTRDLLAVAGSVVFPWCRECQKRKKNSKVLLTFMTDCLSARCRFTQAGRGGTTTSTTCLSLSYKGGVVPNEEVSKSFMEHIHRL